MFASLYRLQTPDRENASNKEAASAEVKILMRKVPVANQAKNSDFDVMNRNKTCEVVIACGGIKSIINSL